MPAVQPKATRLSRWPLALLRLPAALIFCTVANVLGNAQAQAPNGVIGNLANVNGVDGVSGPVFAMDWDAARTTLLVGGDFGRAGGCAANSIVKWNGTAFVALVDPSGINGVDGRVLALARDPVHTTVYIGGSFVTAGVVTANNIVQWNGTAFASLIQPNGQTGVNGPVHALAWDPARKALYVGGAFESAGGVTTKNIVKWNGTAFTPLVHPNGIDGVDSLVAAFAWDAVQTTLYIGGSFTSAGGVSAAYIVKWNGTAFIPLVHPNSADELDSSVMALAWDPDSAALYVGGNFNGVRRSMGQGGLAAQCLVKWNGTAFIPFQFANGTSWTGSIANALAWDSVTNTLYAGGWFETARGAEGHSIMRCNDTVCIPLMHEHGSTDTDSSVYALAAAGGTASRALYVGGAFETAGDRTVNYLANWNGTAFRPLTAPSSARGVDKLVQALAWDTASATLYLGGAFTIAGGLTANAVVKWDGMAFTPLKHLQTGTNGVEGTVRALAWDPAQSTLYIGGNFRAPGTSGADSANHVVRWRHFFSPLMHPNGINGVNGAVNTLAWDPTQATLYVGGDFDLAGGIAANFVVRWNGTAFLPLVPPSGIPGVNGTVHALAWNSAYATLYIGGDFKTAGGRTANSVVQWDGAAFIPLVDADGANGIGGSVRALVWDSTGSMLYIGGNFTVAGGGMAHFLVKWNSTAFVPLVDRSGTDGVNGIVTALAWDPVNTTLYVAGEFQTAGHLVAANIVRWSESATAFIPLLHANGGNGLDGAVSTLMWVEGSRALYVGGNFTSRAVMWQDSNVSSLLESTPSPSPSPSLTVWGPVPATVSPSAISRWHALGNGTNAAVYALAMIGGNLYAGGEFTEAGGMPTNFTAMWDGTHWAPLGTGTSDPVFAVAGAGSIVYVGGGFAEAGGVPASGIAVWNGTAWAALGEGIAGAVRAIVVDGDRVYAGGSCTIAGAADRYAANVVVWNGASWSALGGGVDNDVYALATSGGNLYAGGAFTTAGDISSWGIAVWNTTTWSALGAGFDHAVLALAILDSVLYAGGRFPRVGAADAIVNSVACWNGSNWNAVVDDSIERSAAVRALAFLDTRLIAAGSFSIVGDAAAGNIAMWNGSTWSPLDGGVGPAGAAVYALASNGTSVYVGGEFAMAGGQPPNFIARWDIHHAAPALTPSPNVTRSAPAMAGPDATAMPTSSATQPSQMLWPSESARLPVAPAGPATSSQLMTTSGTKVASVNPVPHASGFVGERSPSSSSFTSITALPSRARAVEGFTSSTAIVNASNITVSRRSGVQSESSLPQVIPAAVVQVRMNIFVQLTLDAAGNRANNTSLLLRFVAEPIASLACALRWIAADVFDVPRQQTYIAQLTARPSYDSAFAQLRLPERDCVPLDEELEVLLVPGLHRTRMLTHAGRHSRLGNKSTKTDEKLQDLLPALQPSKHQRLPFEAIDPRLARLLQQPGEALSPCPAVAQLIGAIGTTMNTTVPMYQVFVQFASNNTNVNRSRADRSAHTLDTWKQAASSATNVSPGSAGITTQVLLALDNVGVAVQPAVNVSSFVCLSDGTDVVGLLQTRPDMLMATGLLSSAAVAAIAAILAVVGLLICAISCCALRSRYKRLLDNLVVLSSLRQRADVAALLESCTL